MDKNRYLEIYPSEVAIKKVDKHLDEMLRVKPKIYRKTLNRYVQLLLHLLECAEKSLKFMQNETLMSSETLEFQELAMSSLQDLSSALNRVNAQFDALTNLSRSSTPVIEKPRVSNKRVMHLYGETLNAGVNTNFGYAEVNECAYLIYTWYTNRFSGNNPNFKYQVKQLPNWISYIIIAYGKYLSEGPVNKDTFVTEFISWCDSLDSDPTNCWALPMNIFSMTKNIKAQDYTLYALIINDILTDKCYYRLGDLDTEYRYDASIIVTLIRNNNMTLEPFVRVRLAKQSEFIQELGLTPCTEISEL